VTHGDVTRRAGSSTIVRSHYFGRCTGDLLFVSVLLIPLIAYLATDRPMWSVGVLAGAAAFFALLPLGIAVAALQSTAPSASLLPLGIGLVFAVGSTAVLFRVRYSDGATMTAMLLLVGGLWMFLPRVVR